MSKEKATQIVDGIIADLTDRKGLRQEWDMMDEDIQEEIKETWIGLIVEGISEDSNDKPKEAKVEFIAMDLVRGNVIVNLEGYKTCIRQDRPMVEGEVFVCERPHEDGSYAYMCHREYCRCSS